MSWASSIFKLGACISVVSGITALPVSYKSPTNETNEVLKLPEPPLLTKQEKNPTILIGKPNNENSLSLVNTKKLLEKIQKTGVRATFKEVGMKWGNETLNEYDILFSPCQEGDYYLMRGNGRNQYKLEDGTSVVRTLTCWESKQPKYQKLKRVTMQFKNPHLRGSSLTSDKLSLGSCLFSKDKEFSLNMICYEYFDGRKGFGNIAWGILTFDKED